MNPVKLRQTMRAKRRALSREEQRQASLNLCENLQPFITPLVKNVALYLANDGEISPDTFIKSLWLNKIDVYLPVLHPFSKGNLLFLRFDQHTQMQVNKYGISEPALDVRQVCPVADIDIMFTPLVAFDAQGNRMGMGGGYYDRTLAQQPQLTTIGLAHDCQQVDKLTTQPWDMPMNGIVTPSHRLLIS